LVKAIANSEVINFSSREPSLEELFLTYYRDGSGTKVDEVRAVRR
jgi:hypothetical protein